MVEISEINLKTIIKKNYRLDAGAFDIESIIFLKKIEEVKYPKKKLCGDNGFGKSFYLGRFKRTFCKKESGLPIYQPSQILELNPKAYKFISKKTKTNLEELKVKKNQILITRSGTIGKIAFVGETLNNKIFSDDLIRFECDKFPGYVYAFLEHKIGSVLLKADEYGSVISHIEPEHLENISLPNPPDSIKKKINDLIIDSFKKRDEFSLLVSKANKILDESLNLSGFKKSSPNNFNTNINKLNFRFDANYHLPIIRKKIDYLNQNSKKLLTVGDSFFSEKIILPPRFKRNYVSKLENGYVFFGGKQILDLDSDDKKFISKKHHKEQYDKFLKIKEGCVLITRSGTIGKIAIAPKHWDSLAINEHVIRIFPSNSGVAGYIYCWLNSDFAEDLIKKFTYGSVVNEIDDNHVSEIFIPILNKQKDMEDINNFILMANQKKYEAFKLEQKALSKIDNLLI